MGSVFFKSLFMILISLGNIRFGSSCQDFGEEDYKDGLTPPKTHIKSAPEHIRFSHGGNVVVIDAVGIQVRFDCWAPYPIDIKFKGHLTNRRGSVGLIERHAKDPWNLSTFCFYINVTLEAYEEITGHYACMSVQNESLQTSHYIYRAAHPSGALLNRKMTLRVVINQTETTIIPCPTSNPYVTVSLYMKKDSRYEPVVDENFRYNPKVGFVVPTKILQSSSPNWYRCATNMSLNDFVDVAVTQPPVIVTPPYSELVVAEGERVTVTCAAPQNVEFSTNIKIKGQSAVIESETHKSFSYKTEPLKAGDEGFIFCISSETGDVLFRWSLRTSKKENETRKASSGNDQKLNLDSFECMLPRSVDGGRRIALHDCNNWVECNLRKCSQLDRMCDSVSCHDGKVSNCVKNGVIQCFNQYNASAQTEIFFSGIRNRKIYTNWERAPKESILKIKRAEKSLEKSTPNARSHFEAELVCDGSAFVFAVGFKWYLVRKDSEIPFPIPDENIQHKWKHLDMKNVIRSTAKMNITTEIKAVICKAPIWNSTGWMEDVYDISRYLKSEGHSIQGRDSGSERALLALTTNAMIILASNFIFY